jgi:predicted RNase H-like nuclease
MVGEVRNLSGLNSSAIQYCAGADGCRAGWIVAFRRAGQNGNGVTFRVAASIADIFQKHRSPCLAIDIPIGLPDRTGRGGRGPERLVRPLLGARRSSVFSVPSRSAVYSDDYGEACARALATSDPPRKVSKQCFHLFPKIREVDAYLRDRRDLAHRVFEAHPEVAFWRMNGNIPLTQPKKASGGIWQPGLEERRLLLLRNGIPGESLAWELPRGVGQDDFLDALANLLVAERIFRGEARVFSADPASDAFGLPVAIWT